MIDLSKIREERDLLANDGIYRFGRTPEDLVMLDGLCSRGLMKLAMIDGELNYVLTPKGQMAWMREPQ